MERFLIVCLGGALGSGARFWLSALVIERASGSFPWGTLAVNVIGSFLMGAIMGVAEESALISPAMRLALATGVMGGFTTYSAFAWDTFKYLEQGSYATAAINVGATTVVCLIACALGLALSKLVV